MGIYPEPFWSLYWWEYDLMVDAYFLNDDEKWRHTREIMAKIHNTNITKLSQARTGVQILPLSSDKPVKNIINSTLSKFKAACKRFKTNWNPK